MGKIQALYYYTFEYIENINTVTYKGMHTKAVHEYEKIFYSN